MKSSSRWAARIYRFHFRSFGQEGIRLGGKSWWWIVASLLIAVPAKGQMPGTTVQLPSFHNFSYSGSVMVPDAGDAYLGGFGRAGDRTNRYRSGFPGLNTSSLRSMSSAHASAYVIDHAQWDRAVLGGTPAEFLQQRRSGDGLPKGQPVGLPGMRANELGANTIAAESRPVAGADPNELGKKLVRMGRRAAELGDPHWTRFYYQLAQKNLDARLANLAQLEYEKQLGKLGAAAPPLTMPRGKE
ncbi:hypothetical protein SH139x_005203 [Planctomycetaceae bacterium SH139]